MANPFDSAVDLLDQTQGASPEPGMTAATAGVAVSPTTVMPQEDEQRASRRAVIQSNLSEVITKPADQSAADMKLAQSQGVPPETVGRNRELFNKRQRVQDIDFAALLDESPQLAQELEDKHFASVSHDDLQNLSSVERAIRATSTGFQQGREASTLNRAIFARNMSPISTPELDATISKMRAKAANQQEFDGFAGWIQAAAQFAGNIESSIEAGAAGAGGGAAAGAALGAPVGGVGALPGAAGGAAIGFGVGFTTDLVVTSMGDAFNSLEQVEAEQGQKLNPYAKYSVATGVGVVNAALERLSLGLLAKPMQEATKRLVTQKATEKLTSASFKQAATKFGKAYAEGVATNTLQEGLQSVMNSVGADIAANISYENYQGLLEDPAKMSAALDDAFNSMEMAFKGSVLIGLPGPGFNYTHDMYTLNRSKNNQTALRAIADGSQNSALAKRLPEQFQQFVARVKERAGPAGLENVYIPAKEFATYFQSQGQNDVAIAAELGLNDQYQQALDSEGDLVVPIETVAGKLALTEYYQGLEPFIKVAPDDMSLAEIKAFNPDDARMQQEANDAQTAMQEADKQGASDRVFSQLYAQLLNTSGNTEVALTQATLVGGIYDALASRSSVKDPEALLRRFGLTIQNVLPEAVRKRVDVVRRIKPIDRAKQVELMAEATPEARQYIADAEALLNAAKSIKSNQVDVNDPRAIARATGMKPTSLFTRIDQLGGINVGQLTPLEIANIKAAKGSLRAYDGELGDVWDGNPKLRSRFVRRSGKSPDDLARELGEEGYFGAEFMNQYREGTGVANTAGINELFNAMQREAGGERIYPLDVMDAIASLKVDPREEEAIYKYLEDLGVDENSTPVKVAEAMAKKAQDSNQSLQDAQAAVDTQGQQGAGLTDAEWEAAFGNTYFQSAPTVSSKAFKDWFGESKVVGENGEPLVVYHGTKAAVDKSFAFDYTKIGQQGRTEGAGFYFTPDRAIAEGYGDVMEVYLSIKKPMAYETKPFTGKTLNAILKGVAEAEAEYRGQTVEDGFLSNFGDVASDGVDSVLREAAKVMADNGTALDQLSDLVSQGVPIEVVNRVTQKVTGYDGIVAKGFGNQGDSPIYVAFFPEQVKSISNQNPTNSAQIYFQSAYHGSPHDFEQFLLDHIGSGEGNQAFGYGLYFASKREIAEMYREVLSPKPNKFFVDGKEAFEGSAKNPEQFAIVQVAYNGIDGALKNIQELEDMGKLSPENAAKRRNDIEILRGKDVTYKEQKGGKVYEVDIPSDEVMLDWDKPISKQPEQVKSSLQQLGIIHDKAAADKYDNQLLAALQGNADAPKDTANIENITGQQVYSKLMLEVGRNRSKLQDKFGEDVWGRADKLVSMLLNDVGIKGIKYLDGNSRVKGEGSHNYVVFDDKAVTLLNKYYQDGRGNGNSNATPPVKSGLTRVYYGGAKPDGAVTTATLDIEQAKKDAGKDGLVYFVDVPSGKGFLRNGFDGNMSAKQAAGMKQYKEPARRQMVAPGTTEPRGSIQFMEDPAVKGAMQAVINLGPTANLSTFLHETGHLGLEMMRYIIKSGEADESLQADMQTLLEWFGIQDVDAIGRDQHEQFAKGFEIYLREGKAPSLRLHDAFNRFRAWLTRIYRTVAGMGVELNDEVRQVMDRLVATEDEIQQARNLDRFAADPEVMKLMTDAEAAAYKQHIQRAVDYASEQVMKTTLNEVWERQGKPYMEEMARVRDEVTAEVNTQPVYKAIEWLSSGKWIDGTQPEGLTHEKLNRASLVDDFGEGILKALPKGFGTVFTKQGGITADEAAMLFGFGSGQEMVQAMVNAQPRRQVIEERTRNIMRERHGDVMNDGTIEREALENLHNEHRARAIAAELRVLAKNSQKKESVNRYSRQVAKDFVARQKFINISNFNRFYRAEVKASKEAQEAILKGKKDDAVKAKQRQLFNHYLYMEARAANQEVERNVRHFKKLLKAREGRRIDPDYLDQIEKMLARFNFARLSGDEIRRRKSLATFIAEKQADDVILTIPDKIRDEAFQQNYRDMTVDDIRSLFDAVTNIEHNGRLKRKLIVSGQQREFEEVKQGILDSISKNGMKVAERTTQNPTTLDNLVSGAKSKEAALIRVEDLTRTLDGKTELGAVHQAIYGVLADASAEQFKLMKEVSDKVAQIIKGASREQRKRWNQWHEVKAIGKTFKGTDLMAMALNLGNDGNRERLLKGEGWKQEQVDEALKILTKEDWDAVQAIWDLMESLQPKLEEVMKEQTGLKFEKVQAKPVQTPHGIYRGGYYPVVYDKTRSYDAYVAEQQSVVTEDGTGALFDKSPILPEVERGFTKARGSRGIDAPLFLSLDVLPSHLDKVIHYITMVSPVKQVDRLLRDKEIRNAMIGSIGMEQFRILRPWLAAVARGTANDEKLTDWQKSIRWLRTGTTITVLSFKLISGLRQFEGLAPVAGRVGAANTLYGIRQLLNPSQWSYAFGASKILEQRAENFDRDISTVMRSLNRASDIQRLAGKFGMSIISYAQLTIDTAAWHAAHLKWMKEHPMDENGAVRFADSIVRQTQGSGEVLDLIAFQRGDEFQKLWSTFYTPFAVMYNMIRQASKGKAGVKKYADIAHAVFWTVTMPVVMDMMIEAAMKGNTSGDDDDESKLQELALRHLTTVGGAIPVARDLITVATEGRQGGSAIANFTTQGGTVLKDVFTGDVDEKTLKKAIYTASVLTHVPAYNPYKSLEHLMNVATGESDFSVGDLFQGERDRK